MSRWYEMQGLDISWEWKFKWPIRSKCQIFDWNQSEWTSHAHAIRNHNFKKRLETKKDKFFHSKLGSQLCFVMNLPDWSASIVESDQNVY